MPRSGISDPRAASAATRLHVAPHRRDHASATRGRACDAMSHMPSLLVIRHSAEGRGVYTSRGINFTSTGIYGRRVARSA